MYFYTQQFLSQSWFMFCFSNIITFHSVFQNAQIISVTSLSNSLSLYVLSNGFYCLTVHTSFDGINETFHFNIIQQIDRISQITLGRASNIVLANAIKLDVYQLIFPIKFLKSSQKFYNKPFFVFLRVFLTQFNYWKFKPSSFLKKFKKFFNFLLKKKYF